MKRIEVIDCGWDIRTLYANATTKDRRALLGYMLFTGRTDDLIFGGAFKLLKDVEECDGGLYQLKLCSHNHKEIVALVEVAMAGGFRQYSLSRWKVWWISRKINRVLG